MTLTITPKFISPLGDNPNSSARGEVTPTRWNSGSDATMDSGFMLGRISSGTGPVEELSPATVRGMLNVSDNTAIDAALATKEPTVSAGTAAQYYRGDKTWQTLNKSAVGLSNVDNVSLLSAPLASNGITTVFGMSPDNVVVKKIANVVDPADFGADNAGLTNSMQAWQDAIDRGIEVAQETGVRTLYIQPSPGDYLITWNGLTGFNSGMGIAITALNYRTCLLIDSPYIDHVVLIARGCKLKQGGTNKDTWASLFYVNNARLDVIGGTYDMVNFPFTQGTVTTIGANYVDIQIDPAFDQQIPSFAQCSEVITYTAEQYEQDAPLRSPVQFAFDRDEYSGLFAPFVAQGGGVYRITGMSAGEITTFTSRSPVGTYVLVVGMADGCCTFNAMNSPAVTMRDCVNHNALMRFMFVNGAGFFNAEGFRSIPRPGSKALRTGQRGIIDTFNMLGPVRARNCYIFGSGDDAFGITGFTLAEPEYVSATSFRAFSNSHYFGDSAPIGSRFLVYDANYATIATGKITAVGAITPVPNWLALFTVSITSGALPADMSNHIIMVFEGMPWADIQGCSFENIRSRAIWGNLPGNYDNNQIRYVTNEAILINPLGGGGNVSVFISGGLGLSICNNQIFRACLDGFYSAAIRVMCTGFADPLTDQYIPAAAKLYKNVKINENTIRWSSQMAIMVGGVEDGNIVGNKIFSANFASEYGEEQFLGFASKTVIGYAGCSNLLIADNTGQSLSGAAFVAAGTIGTNSKITERGNINYDDAAPATHINIPFGVGAKPPANIQSYTYKSGANARHLIESNGGFNPQIGFKNGDREFTIFGSGFGLFFKDETSALNRWVIDQNGHFAAAGNTLYDIGNATNWIRRFIGRQMAWQDGITAPAAVVGLASSFVDAADGDLKVIFGDGVVKTLATDSGSDFRMVAVPASATATGKPGDFAYATGFMYICVAANTWERVATSTW
jgi:hypothetical protein